MNNSEKKCSVCGEPVTAPIGTWCNKCHNSRDRRNEYSQDVPLFNMFLMPPVKRKVNNG